MSTPLTPPLAKSATCRRCQCKFALEASNPRAYVCPYCKEEAKRRARRNWNKWHRATRADLVSVTRELLELRERIKVLEQVVAADRAEYRGLWQGQRRSA